MASLIGEHATTISAEVRPVLEPEPLTQKQRDRARFSLQLRFGGFLAALAAAGMLMASAHTAYQVHKTLDSWPRAQAEVQRCEIYPKIVHMAGPRSTGPSRLYGFRCNVAYPVGSSIYKSQADLGYLEGRGNAMRPLLDRIHPGDRITIAYDPAAPSRVRFAGDFTLTYAASLLMLRVEACLVAVAIAMTLISKRLRQLSPRSASAEFPPAFPLKPE